MRWERNKHDGEMELRRGNTLWVWIRLTSLGWRIMPLYAPTGGIAGNYYPTEEAAMVAAMISLSHL